MLPVRSVWPIHIVAAVGDSADVRLWTLVGGLLAALGVVAKLELKRYDRLQDRHDRLQDKMADQIYPVMTDFVTAAQSSLLALKDLAGTAQLQRELDSEREARIRAEEELKWLKQRS